MALDCNLSALITASKCFSNPPISQAERDAIEIYARTEGLLAAGGADLTNIDDLLEAAKTWQALVGTQQAGVSTYITVQNAIDNGAAIDTDIQTLSESAKCFLCLPDQTRQQLLLFLRCAISSEGAPA